MEQGNINNSNSEKSAEEIRLERIRFLDEELARLKYKRDHMEAVAHIVPEVGVGKWIPESEKQVEEFVTEPKVEFPETIIEGTNARLMEHMDMREKFNNDPERIKKLLENALKHKESAMYDGGLYKTRLDTFLKTGKGDAETQKKITFLTKKLAEAEKDKKMWNKLCLEYEKDPTKIPKKK